MKNKKLTYFLIVAVIGVWGIIIYRLISAYIAKDEDDVEQSYKPVKEAFNDYNIPPDTAKLQLNYRNPFDGVEQHDTTAGITQKTPTAAMHTAASVKPAINWSFITYSGYIRNAGSKKLVTIVTINGQTVTMQEGETKEQVKLLKNLRDSIKISYAGKTKFIARKWL